MLAFMLELPVTSLRYEQTHPKGEDGDDIKSRGFFTASTLSDCALLEWKLIITFWYLVVHMNVA